MKVVDNNDKKVMARKYLSYRLLSLLQLYW